MIPPVRELSEKLNCVSSKIEQLDKKIHRYRFIITAIDTKIKETACLAAEVAICQLEIVQNLLNMPLEERDFSIIQDSLDEKLKKVREDYLDNYSHHLLEKTEYVEEKILTDDKREELKNEFAKKIDVAILMYKNETVIDENTDLKIIKSHLEENIIKTQEIYDALFKEKKNLTKEQDKQMSSISFEYNQLLEERKNIMKDLEVTDIYSAIQVGAMDFVIKKINSLYFFNKKFTLNRLDSIGFAPLHYAAYHNRFDMLMFLLEQGANCAIRDSYGYQPLHWAAKQGVYAIVRTLIEHNAPIDGKGEYDRTPLHMAVFNGKIATTLLLLDLGANINSQTSKEDNRKTPLHYAVIHRDAGMVKALVGYSRLNVHLTDSRNNTPLYYAITDGLLGIVKLIIQHPGFYSMPSDPNNPNHIENVHDRGNDRIMLDASSDKIDFLSRLPMELLSMIFSFLNLEDVCRCSLVSRNFKEAIEENYIHGSDEQRNKHVSEIVRYILRYKNKEYLNENIMKLLTCFLKNVKKLYLSEYEKANALSIGLVQHCIQLQELSLDSYVRIKDDWLVVTFKSCTQLKNLSLNYCSEITDVSIKVLGQSCTQLQKLCLERCSKITDVSLAVLGRNCTQLQKLYLIGCLQLTDVSLGVVGQNCIQLKNLSLRVCHKITDDSIKVVGQNCTQLQILDLTGCSKITDDSIKIVGHNCTQLQILDLAYFLEITDASIKVVGQNCIRLQILDLTGCSKITNDSIKIVGQNCTQLQKLYLTGCSKITDVSLRVVGQNCTQLQELYLTYFSEITDASIIVIGQNCIQLQVLDLTGCSKITDDSIKVVGQNCTKLQKLYLTYCSKITDDSIKVVRQNCTQLKKIDLIGCPKITGGSTLLS